MTPHPSYKLIQPDSIGHPILISCPHAGVGFPDFVRGDFLDSVVKFPADTDWFIDQVFEAVTKKLKLPMIVAQSSRYVVDLNRPLTQERLYEDDRVETGLFPVQSFSLEPLYREEKMPSLESQERRITEVYQPYYLQVQSQLDGLQSKFGQALLIDAHSIKSRVPSICSQRFADITLGTQQASTCHKQLHERAWRYLECGPYRISDNHPFRGGNITRHFGKPEVGQHAMQFETAQVNYMDEISHQLVPEKLQILQEFFIDLVGELAQELQGLSQSH